MKYCVNVLQPPRILSQADEIKVELKSWEAAYDIKHDYPDAKIIISIPKYSQLIDVPYKDLQELDATVEFDSANNMSLINECVNHDVKYYFRTPIKTWYELNSVLEFNISAIVIGAPLFFDLPKVKEFINKDNIEIRFCPNYVEKSAFSDSLHNAWIRPEDAPLYEGIITTFDFSAGPLGPAAASLKIYKEGTWPGNLALVIEGLNIHVDNRIVPEDFGKSRLRCRQRCMDPNSIPCHLCDRAIELCKAMRDAFYASGGEIDEQTIDE